MDLTIYIDGSQIIFLLKPQDLTLTIFSLSPSKIFDAKNDLILFGDDVIDPADGVFKMNIKRIDRSKGRIQHAVIRVPPNQIIHILITDDLEQTVLRRPAILLGNEVALILGNDQ